LLTSAQRQRASLGSLADALRALSPTATLQRGYAIARLADGTIVRDPGQATVGEPLEVVVARGRLTTRVEDVTRDVGELR
jgi:exodeoxyribonuclease VII large subunit